MGVGRRGERYGVALAIEQLLVREMAFRGIGGLEREGRDGLKKQGLGNSCWHTGIDMREWQARTGSMYWRFQNRDIGRVNLIVRCMR
jgi:hypothetical protein